MRGSTLPARERGLPGRSRRDWWESVPGLALAAAVGILVSELVLNPTRRTIMFTVGLVFAASIASVPTVAALAVLVFLLPFGVTNVLGNSNMIFILFLGVLVAWRRFRAEEPLFTPTALGWPMLLLAGAHLVSFYNVLPDDRVLALQKVFGLITGMVLFLIVVTVVRDVATLRTVLIASIAGCAATCVVAGYELTHAGYSVLPNFFYAPWSARSGVVRAVGTFRNYSNYAQYLAMHILVGTYLLVRARSLAGRTLLLLFLAGAATVFLTTGMRGVFIAIVVAGAYLVLFGRRALPWQQTGGAAVLVAGVLALGAYIVGAVLGLWTIFTRFQELGLVAGSAHSRRQIMGYFFSHAWEQPLIGHGPAIRIPERVSEAILATNPHNQYLYYFYTVGILGLGAFLWFAVRLALAGHRTLVRARPADPSALGLLAVLQGNMVLFLLHEMADDYMFSGISTHVTWLFFGVLTAAIRVARQRPEEDGMG